MQKAEIYLTENPDFLLNKASTSNIGRRFRPLSSLINTD